MSQPGSTPVSPAALRTLAAQWHARVGRGDLDAAEQQAFQRWLDASESHRQAYAEVEQTWASVMALAGRDDLDAWRRQALSARPQPQPRRWLAPAMAALLLCTAAPTAWLLWSRAPSVPVEHYSGAEHDVRSFMLADGSQITLDAGAEVDVRLSGTRRDLTLVRGEALFEVAHDAHRPFVVDAGGHRVTALGTRFDVARGNDDDDVTVTLLDGSVAVDSEGATTAPPTRLSPGQQWRLHDGQAEVDSVNPTVVAAWTHGQLVFDDAPLTEVLARINRYNSVQITIGDPKIRNLRVSGVFHAGAPQAMVRALGQLYPIAVASASDERLVLVGSD